MAGILRFEPDVHTALWGEEEWLVCAHPSSPSRIVGASGKTLRDEIPDFPLLIKRIKAEKRLSVQVHPNDVTAGIIGGEAKTEMWCVLNPGPIFAGFRSGVDESDIARAVADGSFEQLLVRFDAKVGECYFIPGGLVHAIGEGTVVYEVQQSSDTTFRLYDWGRVGADGKPRTLHIKEALDAMDLSMPPPVPSEGISCRYFDFHKVGEVAESGISDHIRVVYDQKDSDTFLIPAGVDAKIPAGAFVTEV